jgi:thiosulfate reductase cytochrome b subunit
MATQSQLASQIREKHPLAIRWMHWVNFPLLFTMIWSGILIYWADSIPYVGHPSQVYRIGIGSHTLFRFFPDWFYNVLHAQYKLTTGLGYHFFFMWLFAINGIHSSAKRHASSKTPASAFAPAQLTEHDAYSDLHHD